MEIVVLLTKDETMVFEELDDTDIEYRNLLDRLQRLTNTASIAARSDKVVRIIGITDDGELHEMVVPDSQG